MWSVKEAVVTAVPLQLAGESLMGWMVWDLMRGVDLLCSREGVDKDRIILVGSVAGGGDPAAVAASVDFASRRTILRDGWSRLLGNITPTGNPRVKAAEHEETNGLVMERIVLEVEPGIVVPLVLMRARDGPSAPLSVVVALADSGKQKFLAARPDTISSWLEAGCAVCWPDVRGFGETSEGESYGPRSIGTTLSCREQVLGQTLLGSRLRDLRSVLLFLRARSGLYENVSLWGDSLAPLNPPGRPEIVPYGVDNPNVQAEPSAGLLVLLAALFEDHVKAVYARGTFASFRSLLESPFLYVPHDSVVPGALTVGDVADIAAALAPRPLLLECPVDGLNRAVPSDTSAGAFAPTSQAYRLANASRQFSLHVTGQDDSAMWLLDQIKRRFPK